MASQCAFFAGQPEQDPLELARSLWDLDTWAAEAARLHGMLDTVTSLKAGFLASAEVIRHLLIDPCLPPELLPGAWPGDGLRERYADFHATYAELLRDYSQG